MRHDVLAIPGCKEPHVAVGPAGIVVIRDSAAVPGRDREHRVKRRANLARKDADVVPLAFPGLEDITIKVPRGRDHSVESHGRSEPVRCRRGVVRLDFDGVAERADPEDVGERGNSLTILCNQAEVVIRNPW